MRRTFSVVIAVAAPVTACSSGTTSPRDPGVARQEKLSALISALPSQE